MNEWLISEALGSTRQLEARVYKLSDEELTHALTLESATRRRQTVLNRLQREVRRRARNSNLQPKPTI
jgi:hypothetical protein